ncbi:hypothetical protein ACFQ4O_10855 [Methylopila musalis]|uniref:Uncharacterized protein n=1 Tax=Methylopila musalis TaxID=1134781 RepID=A0ABW3Z937_9HYPH
MIEKIENFFIFVSILAMYLVGLFFPNAIDVPVPKVESIPYFSIRHKQGEVLLHEPGLTSGSSFLLWKNWGPATRANIYRTEENWLVVLGGGGAAEMFQTSAGGRIVPVPWSDRKRTDDRRWTYVGAADLRFKREPRFYTPQELPECFALFGAGSSPYRLEHQAPSRCPAAP